MKAFFPPQLCRLLELQSTFNQKYSQPLLSIAKLSAWTLYRFHNSNYRKQTNTQAITHWN